MPRFRPPQLPKHLQALDSVFAALYEDLQGLTASRGDVTLHGKTYRASPGETVRVSPPPEGMGLILPPPSAENRAAEITVLIEKPAGELRVFVSQDGPAGPSGAPTIDGEEMAVYSSEGALRFVSNGSTRWSDARGGAGATGATGPTGPAGSDSAMRRIRRHIFYTDGTADIIENGSTTNVALTSFGLDTDGHAYKVWVCPGGTGGNRSPKQRNSTVSDSVAGGGPGGGAIAEELFFREDLEAYIAALGTDIPVTVGAGGAGAPDGPFGEINNAGAVGTLGGLSAFGGLLVAYPGGLGGTPGGISASAQGGGGGGGWAGPGLNGSTSSLTASRPVTSIGSSGSQGDGNFGGGTGYSAATNSPGLSIYGGGGGGGNASGGATNGVGAGRSIRGIPGAGSGGSIDATGVTPRNGGDAGQRGAFTDGLATAGPAPIGGGPVGGTGATGNTGNDGADGADGIPGLYPGESGAGGGALVVTTSGGTGLSGRGGDGGFPGGSGGTGGACFNDSDTLVSDCAAGGGGDGADGCVVVDTLG